MTGRNGLNADSASCQPLCWPNTLPHHPAAGAFCSPPPQSKAHPPRHPSSSSSPHRFISPALKSNPVLLFTFLILRLLVKQKGKETLQYVNKTTTLTVITVSKVKSNSVLHTTALKHFMHLRGFDVTCKRIVEKPSFCSSRICLL